MTTNDLAIIRKCKGLTQQELAEKVGITRQHISAIETGQSRPSVDVAKLIAATLDIKWETFFPSDSSIIQDNEVKDNGGT